MKVSSDKLAWVSKHKKDYTNSMYSSSIFPSVACISLDGTIVGPSGAIEDWMYDTYNLFMAVPFRFVVP